MESKEQRDAAEGDVIDLLRRNDTQNFKLTIVCCEGLWRVTVSDHDAMATDPPSDTTVGIGKTFTEAWVGQMPSWARVQKES